ncbi:MAG: pyridoxal phosphate-dependent aminotransferase [Cetobacterium sp.]
MDIKNLMAPGFREINGGLFSSVEKADVGDGYVKLAEKGVNLMGWADPFYPEGVLPNHISDAMKKFIDEGYPAHYTMPIGNSYLKELIAKKLQNYNNLKVDPKRNILITPGSDSGLFYAMLPFIQQGDEILVPDPSYPNNFLNPKLMGGKTISVPLSSKNNYKLDIDEFQKRVTPKTKMVVLTNPNNPTTTVFSRKELEDLAQFIIKNNLILVVDQAFEDCILGDEEFLSIASLDGMWERTVSVFSFSKGMGLSGFRVGYIVANDKIMDVLYGAAVSVIGATNTLAQIAAIAALENPEFLEEYNKKFEKRANLVYEKFKDIPGIKLNKPESGFLSWIDVSKLGDSTEICKLLIEEACVAVNDGKNYGVQGDGFIRLVHGTLGTEEKLENALDRMAEFFINLGKSKGINI